MAEKRVPRQRHQLGGDEPAAFRKCPVYSSSGLMMPASGSCKTRAGSSRSVADLVADEVVKSPEFAPGVRTDALIGEANSVILFEPDAEADAEALAAAVEKDLGKTDIEEMTEAVRDQAKGAPLALLVGAEDALVGQEAAPTDAAVP